MKAKHISTMVILSLLLAVGNAGLGGNGKVAAAIIQQASFTTNFHDPPGFIVNNVRNAVAASIDDNGTVTAVNCRETIYWLTESGWEVQARNLDCVNGGSYGDSSSYARFYNYPFCGGTWTYYSRNHAYATSAGVSGWIDNAYATGNCWDWLWVDNWFEPGVYH